MIHDFDNHCCLTNSQPPIGCDHESSVWIAMRKNVSAISDNVSEIRLLETYSANSVPLPIAVLGNLSGNSRFSISLSRLTEVAPVV